MSNLAPMESVARSFATFRDPAEGSMPVPRVIRPSPRLALSAVLATPFSLSGAAAAIFRGARLRPHGSLRGAAALALGLLAALTATSAPTFAGAPARPPAAPVPQPNLVDFIAPPGTKQAFRPFMLHADLWVGIDQRARLDSIVYALEKGARCCRVLDADSLWAVDYTWIYPHNLLPRRWYDADDLMRAGDSLAIGDDAAITFTFGTCRIGVRAKTYEQARAEALRLWPAEMPPRLRGRLRLKLERAEKALRGEISDR
jgi:hypothetical protein